MSEASVIQSRIDVTSDDYKQNLAEMQALWNEVAEEMAKVPGIGGQRYVDRHRSRGKMLVRERVEALIDPNTALLELSPLAGWGTQDPIGVGTFNGNEDSNPVVGTKGNTHSEKEIQINVTYNKHIQHAILQALFSSHPYEEVAYEITTLENQNQNLGMGMVAEFKDAITEDEFLKTLKSTFNCGVVRHSSIIGTPIKKVAVLGGSGAFAIGAAKSKQADAYVTADLKYHDFYQAEDSILLADIGHYESEQFTKELLHSYITKKFTNFATVLSKTNTNPIKYL